MKESPDMKRLEETLRNAPMVRGGFLGDDMRPVTEVIETDLAELERLGVTPEQLAERMKEITEKAQERLGNWCDLDDHLQARVEEAKGLIVCPWPHPAEFKKRATTARRTDLGREILWTDLSIHLIGKHGFFEGRGTAFRLEPREAVEMLFPSRSGG